MAMSAPRVGLIVVSIGATVVAGAANIEPDSAFSNLYAWAKFLHLPETYAKVLAAPTVDDWLTVIAVFIAGLAIGRLLPRRLWAQRAKDGRSLRDGVEFYPDRHVLETERPLAATLSGVRNLQAVLVAGSNLFNRLPSATRLNRLILPHPDAPGVKRFEQDQPGMAVAQVIREVTRAAKRQGVQVRWYPNWIGYSILLADISEADGFVHFETVLPFAERTDRPSVTIRRRAYPSVIQSFGKLFDKMWEVSDEAEV